MLYEINNDIETRYRLIKYYFPGRIQSINLLFCALTIFVFVRGCEDLSYVRVDLGYETANCFLKITDANVLNDIQTWAAFISR